jgi:hypothetical protein
MRKAGLPETIVIAREDCVSYDPNTLRFEHAVDAWIVTDRTEADER